MLTVLRYTTLLPSARRYKQDLLTSYSFRLSAGDSIKKINYNPEELDVDGIKIYNTTAISYATGASCSSFFYFPKNDMSVTFQFFNCKEPKKQEDKEELSKAIDFIRSYLNQVRQCQSK